MLRLCGPTQAAVLVSQQNRSYAGVGTQMIARRQETAALRNLDPVYVR